MVVEFESGKAVVNHAILGKMERALGTCVCVCVHVCMYNLGMGSNGI